METRDSADAVRVDVWLDVACLFRTRSEARRALELGKVEVNGQRVKPHRALRVGDELVIARTGGRRQTIVVRGLAERSMPKADARALYEDRTPPPTPEEVEARRLERIFRAMNHPLRAPDKRDRRAARKLKER